MNEVNLDAILRVLPSDIASVKILEKENDVMHFKYKGCVAVVGMGVTTSHGRKRPWATVYRLERNNRPIEDSQHLLKSLKGIFESQAYDFAYSFADTVTIKGILYKCGIRVRERGIGEVVKLAVA